MKGHAHAGDFSRWTFDLWIIAPLAISAVAYARGVERLRARAGANRGIHHWQIACYAAGWCVLVLALVSPMHWLGERLFTAHMFEHELMMAVAAPLIAVSRPIGAFLWTLPRRLRCGFGAVAGFGFVAAPWRVLRDPFSATVLHGLAIWAWHAPALFDAALQNPAIHRLQHLSFFGTGLLFWWALLSVPRRAYGTASLHLFATMAHMGLLGALLTFSSRTWYHSPNAQPALWGLTPLEDQQLAGLVMWIPAGLIYAGAALALLAIWIGHSNAGAWKGKARALASH